MLAIVLSPMSLPPRTLAGISAQVGAGDVVVDPYFTPPQPAEKAFGQIGAGLIRAVTFLVVDALYVKLGVQAVPVRGVIRHHDGPGLDEVHHIAGSNRLVLEGTRKKGRRPAHGPPPRIGPFRLPSGPSDRPAEMTVALDGVSHEPSESRARGPDHPATG
jgi:hypothetical protein